MEFRKIKVQTKDGLLIELDDIVVDNCSRISDLLKRSPSELSILENIHSTVMEKIIEWCKLSADRPIFDGPEYEMENCRGRLADWNENFMRENWANIGEITRGAIELGCSGLAKSCRFVAIRDMHKMSPHKLLRGVLF